MSGGGVLALGEQRQVMAGPAEAAKHDRQWRFGWQWTIAKEIFPVGPLSLVEQQHTAALLGIDLHLVAEASVKTPLIPR